MLPKRFAIISNWSCKSKLAVIVDIGTDHGKLARYLAKKNQQRQIIAVDIRSHIIEKQQNNELNQNLKNLHFRQSDGLEAVNEKIDLAIAAGMGEQTILKILKQAKRAKYYIFQLRQEPIKIRKWCQKENYRFLEDTIIFDRKHYYHTLFVGLKKGKVFRADNLLFGDYQKRSKVCDNYWEQKIVKLEKIAENLSDQKRKDFYQSKIVPIKNIIAK